MYDYANTYFLPFICLFGIITNIINAKVLIKMKPDNNINNYLLVKSCCDLSFLITQSFTFIIRCGSLCPYSYSYEAKFYEAYIHRYFGYVLISFSFSLDMTASIERILSFKITSGNNKFQIPFRIRCVILLIISTLICIPQYVLFSLPKAVGKLYVYDSKKNSTSYEVIYQLKNGENEELKNLVVVLKYIRGYFCICFYALLNLFIIVKLKKHSVKKNSITIIENINSAKLSFKKNLSKEKRKTWMIFVIFLNYLFGHAIESFFVSNYFENNIFVKNLVYVIANLFLYISHGLNLLIYLYFDKKFRLFLFSNHNCVFS